MHHYGQQPQTLFHACCGSTAEANQWQRKVTWVRKIMRLVVAQNLILCQNINHPPLFGGILDLKRMMSTTARCCAGRAWRKLRRSRVAQQTRFTNTIACCMKSVLQWEKQSSQKKPKLSGGTDAFSSVTPYESTSTRHKDITDAITYHIAKDMTLC